MTKTLEAICSYRSEKASASLIRTEDLYISTESISSNRGGVSRASVPGKGKVARFRDGDTLVSNIRPYFKKIWQADCDGYCSNDVLVFQPAEDCNPDYLYWLLCGDEFFEHVMATSKGTKMPRGDKAAIMSYAIPSNSEMAQLQIASIMNPFRSKIAANAQLNGYLAELVDALFCEIVLGAVDSSKTVSFSSILEEQREKCPSRTNAEYSVTDTGIHPRSLKFRKNLSATSSKNKIARKDDLVFGISRRILNWGLFDAEIGEVSSAYRVYSISGVPPEYVARYIARYQYAFTDIIKPSSREGQGIMPDALMAKKLPKLNYFAWEKYLDTVAPIKALASITRTETAALFELRDSVLPKLMSGEIDVSKIDPAQLNSHLA